MRTVTRRGIQKVVESGDFTRNLAKKKGGRMDTRKKQLINLPDDQKDWIMRVVELAVESGEECNQTEVIRAVVGHAMAEPAESFVTRLKKLKLKVRLDDIERRSAALEAEKAKLTEAMEKDGRGQLTSRAS